MIGRRGFVLLGGLAAIWPCATSAQKGRKPVIGVLFHSNPEPALGLLRDVLAGLGYRDGDTVQLDLRIADGSDVKLEAMATDLVTRKVDMIVAFTTPAVLAAKAATSSIPIIMGSAADPVGSGLVASLARPGGNVTGASAAIAEMSGKLLGLLKEALPTASRIGVLVNAADPFHVRLIEQIEVANQTVRIDLRIFRVTRRDDISSAFDAMIAQKIDAAIIQPTLPRQVVIALSLQHRLPTASTVRGYALDGGLMSYGGRLADNVAVAAGHIDRVLKGAKPADIPVQQPAKYELLINLKTAQALQIALPPTFVANADEVIE